MARRRHGNPRDSLGVGEEGWAVGEFAGFGPSRADAAVAIEHELGYATVFGRAKECERRSNVVRDVVDERSLARRFAEADRDEAQTRGAEARSKLRQLLEPPARSRWFEQ